MDLHDSYLHDVATELQKLKALADKALAQVADADLFSQLDSESNSLAMIVQHLAGGLRSRWTDFLTTDGEKPDRHRDREFEIAPGTTRADLASRWEDGWARFFATLDALTPGDLARSVTIRHEPHTVPQAIQRGLLHCAYHVGQIVLLAKHARSAEWRPLSVPRGGSEDFLREMAATHRK